MENHGCTGGSKQQQWKKINSSGKKESVLTLIGKGGEGDGMSSGPYPRTELKQRNELLMVEYHNRDRPKTSLGVNIWGQNFSGR